MTLTYFNDINVYFHMKNHYKMLKQAKSVIDTSVPQSLLKSPLVMLHLQKELKGTTNENLRKIYNNSAFMSKRRGQVKKHSCLNSEARSEASLRTGLPSRPTTRRNPIVTPKETLPARSWSVGPPTKTEKMFRFRQRKRSSMSSARGSNAESQNTNLQLDLEKANEQGPSESTPSIKTSPGSKNSNHKDPEESTKPEDNLFFKESSEEHDYLLFLLRITEDIIVNDFYSNNDIKQVFKFHIEANKDILNVRKMKFHIRNLCRDLNIDCKEYQTIEEDQTDSREKFMSSPFSGSHYLSNEAFLNCHDCSTIRTSSLYKMAPPFGVNVQVMDNINVPVMENSLDNTITPSLLKLLDKLSLGRVTECTEPVASTSTMSSPKCLVPNMFGKEESKIDDVEKSPMDFDTFVKELNSKEDIKSADKISKKEGIILESPPIEIYTTLVKDNVFETINLLENPSDVISSKISPENSVEVPKLLNEDSKSEIEISIQEMKSLTISEKYESEFEKSTSSNSILNYDKSEKSDEEKAKHNSEKEEEKKPETIDKLITLNETSRDEIKENKENVINSSENIVLIHDEQSPVKNTSKKNSPLTVSPVKIIELEDKNLTLPDSLLNTDRTSDPKTDNSYESEVNIATKLDSLETDQHKHTKVEKTVIIRNQTDFSGQPLVTTTSKTASFIPIETVRVNQPKNKNAGPLESLHTTNMKTPKKSSCRHQTHKKRGPELSENQNNERQDTVLKVFLQGSLNDSDYVMIKGPVYIYKPLLESDPKLVVFNNEGCRRSRRNSVDSEQSNRTFTVDTSHVREECDINRDVERTNIDEAIQFDASLHSMANDSMENILELTRRAYSQFSDSKLLLSDYDLTPQKDSDNKYHHLLVDVSTSVSGVNIKESLLLGDDYLVNNGENSDNLNRRQIFNTSTGKEDEKSADDIDAYLKLQPKLFDDNYVINRKRTLVSSASMPKLTLNHSTTTNGTSSDRLYESFDGKGDGNELNGGKSLAKCSSDLWNFDMPSLDSSLRSEGETYPNFDKMRGVHWNGYHN